ncbi:MCP four helix bundle domain-containing protein [Solemya pervernicosa gill symbiont]|uniref:hypothetical protein n=1 Tax=Solemya pervernicosa gill symbiont TaxID=642797 RepID=UPI001083695A|nr:hypothetical protein [Solemya pervernicosa gill symbiont]
MNNLLTNLRVFHKLLFVIVISAIGMIVVGAISMQELRSSLYEDRKLKTRHFVVRSRSQLRICRRRRLSRTNRLRFAIHGGQRWLKPSMS